MGKGCGHEINTWELFTSIKSAPVSLKKSWDRVAVQAAQPSVGSGSGVAPAGRMAPVSSRLRARQSLYSRYMESQDASTSVFRSFLLHTLVIPQGVWMSIWLYGRLTVTIAMPYFIVMYVGTLICSALTQSEICTARCCRGLLQRFLQA